MASLQYSTIHNSDCVCNLELMAVDATYSKLQSPGLHTVTLLMAADSYLKKSVIESMPEAL